MGEQVNEIMRFLDTIEGLCQKYSWTNYRTKKTDSEACSEIADGLRVLAEYGNRFRITSDRGRQVYGYWPENDPEK